MNIAVNSPCRDVFFALLDGHPELTFMKRIIGVKQNGQLIVGKGDRPWESGVIVYFDPATAPTDSDYLRLIEKTSIYVASLH